MTAPVLDTTAGDNSSQGTRSTSVTSLQIQTGGTDRILVACIFCVNDDNAGGVAQTVSTVTDTSGLTWTKRAAKAWTYMNSGFTIFPDIEIWWAHAPTAITGSTTFVTATFTGSVQQSAIRVFPVENMASMTAPWDTEGSLPFLADDVSGSSTLPSVAVTTTQSNDFLIQAMFQKDISANAAGSGYTRLSNLTMGNGDGVTAGWFGVQYKIVSGPLAASTESWANTTTEWGVAADALTADAGTPPPAVPNPQPVIVIMQ